MIRTNPGDIVKTHTSIVLHSVVHSLEEDLAQCAERHIDEIDGNDCPTCTLLAHVVEKLGPRP
jgi:hypothetical protein